MSKKKRINSKKNLDNMDKEIFKNKMNKKIKKEINFFIFSCIFFLIFSSLYFNTKSCHDMFCFEQGLQILSSFFFLFMSVITFIVYLIKVFLRIKEKGINKDDRKYYLLYLFLIVITFIIILQPTIFSNSEKSELDRNVYENKKIIFDFLYDDLKLCYLNSKYNFKEDRNSYCHEWWALKLNMPSFCEGSQYSNWCYKDIALEMGEYKICDKVSSNSRYEDCIIPYSEKYDISNKNEICESLKTSAKKDYIDCVIMHPNENISLKECFNILGFSNDYCEENLKKDMTQDECFDIYGKNSGNCRAESIFRNKISMVGLTIEYLHNKKYCEVDSDCRSPSCNLFNRFNFNPEFEEDQYSCLNETPKIIKCVENLCSFENNS